MHPVTGIATVFALAAPHPSARAVESLYEAADAYEIAAATAISVLPPPLREFYQPRLDHVRRSATAGLTGASTSDALPGGPDWHYVMLDVAADGGGFDHRRAAARSFPHDRSAAAALFKRLGRRAGGSLPWVVNDRCAALTDAFRAGDAGTVVRRTGVLIHFATDAALPYNTTIDRDGGSTGNLLWSKADDINSDDLTHRTVRRRQQLVLIRRLKSRLDYEVRVSPERHGIVTNPLDAVFDTLLDAHRTLERLLAVDARITSDLGIVDRGTFAAAKDAYYGRLADRAAAIMESRLEAAGLLAGNLIGTAWTLAGSPPLPGHAAGAARSKHAAARAFVASRKSNVFHRAACRHARRIKPTNRVFFDTPDSARDAGRVPCKTCSPATPGTDD